MATARTARTAPPPTSEEEFTANEGILTLLALGAAGVSPLLIVAASAGLAPMPMLLFGVGVPGMLVLAAIFTYARSAGLDRLYQRLLLGVVGVVGGLVLTMALDVVRVAGVHLGYLPDSISMFGAMITGAGAMADPTPLSYSLGGAYHFFNGIGFAVVYSILFSRTPWWGSVLFSVVFVETAMMTLPPMAPKFGPFGLDKFGTVFNGFYVDTLLAHAAMGVALGVIMHRFARHRGLLLAPFTRT